MFDKTLARIGASLEKAGIPYMIIHKIFAGRPRDIEDVQTVILKNTAIDIPYIEEWLNAFDAVSDEKNFLATYREIAGGSRRGGVPS
jgi:hypothetical protein